MSNFEKQFLDNYLKFGLVSMPKSDEDAIVIHILDMFGLDGSDSLAIHGNQTVSEHLKTLVTKIKKLRYDASLKFAEGPAKAAVPGVVKVFKAHMGSV